MQCNSVVLSYSHPAESQSISCEEMSFLQLSSCGHFISDHSDAKLQRLASRWSRCKLTSNFSWVEANSESAKHQKTFCVALALVCSLLALSSMFTTAFCLRHSVKRPPAEERRKISAHILHAFCGTNSGFVVQIRNITEEDVRRVGLLV